MFCTSCGTQVPDGAHFCENCGATLQTPGGVTQNVPARPGRQPAAAKAKDPYQAQINQLKLQIRQLKLDLKRINTDMSAIRAQYNQTSAFVPRGLLKRVDRGIEDVRLMGPQQQKQALQQQIMSLQQQLLGLQQQQAQWQGQRQG